MNNKLYFFLNKPHQEIENPSHLPIIKKNRRKLGQQATTLLGGRQTLGVTAIIIYSIWK
jgi:hypothetical protein